MFHVKQLFSNEILSNPQAKSLQCKNNLKNPAKKQEIKNNANTVPNKVFPKKMLSHKVLRYDCMEVD